MHSLPDPVSRRAVRKSLIGQNWEFPGIPQIFQPIRDSLSFSSKIIHVKVSLYKCTQIAFKHSSWQRFVSMMAAIVNSSYSDSEFIGFSAEDVSLANEKYDRIVQIENEDISDLGISDFSKRWGWKRGVWSRQSWFRSVSRCRSVAKYLQCNPDWWVCLRCRACWYYICPSMFSICTKNFRNFELIIKKL